MDENKNAIYITVSDMLRLYAADGSGLFKENYVKLISGQLQASVAPWVRESGEEPQSWWVSFHQK